MIGDGKGTGKVISRGLLPPDDPVFKEGWSIYMVPQSDKPLSTLSSSTPDRTLEQDQDNQQDNQ